MKRKTSLCVAAAFFAIAGWGGEHAWGQCGGGGGSGGVTGVSSATTSAPATVASTTQALAASANFSAGNVMAMRYQQSVNAAQRQFANSIYEHAMRQRLISVQRESQAKTNRLARAEASRAARAGRIADRLRQQGRSAEAYAFTSRVRVSE